MTRKFFAVLFVALWAVPAMAQVRSIPEQYQSAYWNYQAGNYSAALVTWQGLASQGHADSAYALGTLYDLGLGVEPDPAAALRWYDFAERLGSQEAAQQIRLRAPQNNIQPVNNAVRIGPTKSSGPVLEGFDGAVTAPRPNVITTDNFDPLSQRDPFGRASHFFESGQGVYFSFGIAGLFVDDSDGSVPPLSSSLEYGTGFAVTGALGYELAPIRLELEAGIGTADSDSATLGNVDLTEDGEFEYYSFLLNGYYDIGFSDLKINPYIGGGLGFGVVDKTSSAFNLDESNLDFIAHAEGGLSYIVNPSFILDVSYRYMYFDNGASGFDNDTAHQLRVSARTPLDWF